MSCACARVWVLARAPGMAPVLHSRFALLRCHNEPLMIGAIVCASCERAARSTSPMAFDGSAQKVSLNF